jgi:hypothetical protein
MQHLLQKGLLIQRVRKLPLSVQIYAATMQPLDPTLYILKEQKLYYSTAKDDILAIDATVLMLKAKA